MSELSVITEDRYHDVIAELQNAFFDIPFGNSDFQTKAFVIAAQITPERMYRQIGMTLLARLRDLQGVQYDQARDEIRLEQLQEKIRDPNIGIYDRKLAEIDLKQAEDFLYDKKKSLNDLLRELNLLYSYFKMFPSITREQFEAGEKLHFEQRLARQILGLSGAKESMINMTDDSSTVEKFQELSLDSSSQQIELAELQRLVEESLCHRLDLDLIQEEKQSETHHKIQHG